MNSVANKVAVIYSAAYGTGAGSAYPFMSLVGYDQSREVAVAVPADLPENNGFLIIWGGEDIHPSIYGQPNMGSAVWGDGPSKKDMLEMALVNKAVDIGMPVLGVCRGAQLVCAMAGGKLVQDVSGHGGNHQITTNDGKTFITSSVHHQMMYPGKTNHELVAWSTNKISQRYRGLTDEEIQSFDKEPEIVFFPEKRFLAVQGHPEFMRENCEFNNYVRGLLEHYAFA